MVNLKIPEPDVSFSLVFVGSISLTVAAIGTLISTAFSWFNLAFMFTVLFFYLGWKKKKA